MATTFAELFGGVFPTPEKVLDGEVYGPLGDDMTGTLEVGSGGGDATLAKQEEILAELAKVIKSGESATHHNPSRNKTETVVVTRVDDE